MNGNYGVTRDIYAKMKVAGFVMWKLVAVALSLVIAFFTMSKIFPNEGIWRYMQLVYVGLTPTWAHRRGQPCRQGRHAVPLHAELRKNESGGQRI